MSRLSYLEWDPEDVMPDALFPYEEYDVQKFMSLKRSFLADYRILFSERSAYVGFTIQAIQNGQYVTTESLNALLRKIKALSHMLSRALPSKGHRAVFDRIHKSAGDLIYKKDSAHFQALYNDYMALMTIQSGIGDILYYDWLPFMCKQYNVNPKTILVTLQKEQSLVTKKKEPSERIMSRAAGYGMTDAGDIVSLHGFAMQNIGAIMDKARDLRKYKNKKRQPTKKVDDGTLEITPRNAFTSVLYEYTPWTGAPDSMFYRKWGTHGVYLFWLVWKGWWPGDLKKYFHVDPIDKGDS